MVTITDVKVTGDLHDATVYYTVLGETVPAPPDPRSRAADARRARRHVRATTSAVSASPSGGSPDSSCCSTMPQHSTSRALAAR